MTDRGERNNNPCNIRKTGAVWYGASPDQTDPDFVQFQAVEYGLRAACKILFSYAERGLCTVQQIIDTWAPPSENDSTAYVEDACTRTGFSAGQELNVNDPTTLSKLLKALIQHENGEQPYDDNTINAAIRMAQVTT